MSNKVCIQNKVEDLNITVFNMITGTNESKTLAKHISWECKCKFDGTKCNSNQWWNNSKCWCKCKNIIYVKKDYVWNPVSCNYENRKYLARIMDDLVITCDEVIESYNKELKTILTNFNEKNKVIKYQGKQKYLLPLHEAKLKQFRVGGID